MKLVSRWLVFLALCSFLVPPAAQAGTGHTDDPFVFGVVPARSPDKLLKAFGPLVTEIEAKLGISVILRGAPDYETFIRRLSDNRNFDFVLTGGDAFQYIREQGQFTGIAQMKGEGVFALICARRDSRFKTLDDLTGGARVATVDPLAYSTGLGLRALDQAGIDTEGDIELIEVPSQSAAMLSLIRRQVDAAIIMLPVFKTAGPQVTDQLVVLAETTRAPPPLISASTELAEADVRRLAHFLYQLDQTASGREILAGFAWPGFEPVRLEDYDQLNWAARSIRDRLEALD